MTVTFTHAIGINRYGEADLIVSTTAANATHTTLSSAMSAAVSGQTIFLRDSVTENVTLTAGVNISAWTGGSLNTPTITGTLTMTTAGTCNISGIRLQTNSAVVLAVTGSAASIVNLFNCYLNCTNNTAITYSTSSGSSGINIYNCIGDLGTTGIGLFAHSASGTMYIENTNFTNSGGSSTANTCSSGILNCDRVQFSNPVTFSSTGTGTFEYSRITTTAQNITSLNGNGGATSYKWCRFDSGSASSISCSGSANKFIDCQIESSNTNAITGVGTISYSNLTFSGTSSQINTTTITPLSNTPTIVPAVQSYIFDDMFTVTEVWDTHTSGTGSNFGNGSLDNSHPGCGEYQTGTTTSGKVSSFYGAQSSLFYGGGTQTIEMLINIPVLSNGTDTWDMYIGIHDNNIFNGGSIQNGVFFQYIQSSSVNWKIGTANGGASTLTTTSTAVATGWTKLKIVSTVAPLHTFYVNGVSVGTISTNTPTNIVGIGTRLNKTAGTTNVLVWWDYFEYLQIFTSSR